MNFFFALAAKSPLGDERSSSVWLSRDENGRMRQKGSSYFFCVVRMGPGCATGLLLVREKIHHRRNRARSIWQLFHHCFFSSFFFKFCLRINNNTLSGQRPKDGPEGHQCNPTRIPTSYYAFVLAHALVDMRFPSRALI